MKHLRLERSFSGHQRVIIIVMTIIFMVKSYEVIGSNEFNWDTMVIAAPFLSLTVLSIGFLLMQNGFSALSNNKIARGWYMYGIPVWFKTINAQKFPVITILKMGKSQKLAWTLAVNPDLAVSFNSYDITSLNEKHTKKDRLVILKKEKSAIKAIDFITSNSDLRNEVFSPDFS